MPPLFHRLAKNIISCFSRQHLLLFLIAIGLTFALVTSGFDWWYYRVFQETELSEFLFSSVIIGVLVPILGIAGFIWISEKRTDHKSLNTGWALGQAALLGYVISSTLKAFTGRMPPPQELIRLHDVSRDFRFGFWRDGIIWGWPSSHTTIAFAMALALCTLYPEKRFLKVFALLYAFYIGIGVSMSVHWFSEFAAGAIIGSVIGVVVGRSFRQHPIAAI